jgi:hypothetical protein
MQYPWNNQYDRSPGDTSPTYLIILHSLSEENIVCETMSNVSSIIAL